jgi:SulP family sulfate permease
LSEEPPHQPPAPGEGDGPPAAPASDGHRLPLVATALRRAWSNGYGLAQFRADASAGLIVGVVALPLSMALGIAVGVAPQHGLYTAVVAGLSVALLGGCKFQVTGPTAAFVVVLVPVVERFGLPGLLFAGFLSGLILVGMALMRLGDLIKFIPYPVTTGFTTGIAVVIATLQVKDLFGLRMEALPPHYWEKLTALWQHRSTWSPTEAAVAGATLALLIALPRISYRLPSPLIAIGGVSVAVAVLQAFDPSLELATIGSRFSSVVDGQTYAGIPPILPSPSLPWAETLNLAAMRALLPAAFAIALLGAIESLLSAVVADGLTGTRHDPNGELLGLGIGNLLAPIFGGIPATGALARTATNIRAGAVSPIASAIHAVFVLLSILLFAPWVAHIPMASLAALLLLVAWNMSEVRHFARLMEIAPAGDRLVLAACFLLTVLFDMVLAIGVGVVLAALLFMRRMSEITESKLFLDTTQEGAPVDLPEGVCVYEVNGPLFFGVAQSALSALHRSQSDRFSVLVLQLGRVPVIDATGFAALESALRALSRRGKRVILVGPLPQPKSIFDRARLAQHEPGLLVKDSLADALGVARGLVEESRNAPRSIAPRP